MGDLRAGQSFVELMVAIAIGAIFMAGAAVIIVSSLGESTQAIEVQTASTNAQSLLNNVRVWSEGNWNNLLSLATGSTYQYYLVTSSSPYTATSGTESIVNATTTYTRYFYVSDVYRSGGNIASAGAYDPSTKQISVVYGWTNGQTSTMSTYLTRNQDAAFDQADWSGGPGASSAATSTGNQFASSSNIDYTTTTGSLYVSIPGY
jgi:prepilin-type N-terminal cleavage/methylation domain-containing protein